MKEGNLFIGADPNIPRGGYDVLELPDDAKLGDIVTYKVLYQNNGALADDFASIGIVYERLCKGKKVLLSRHPDDKFEVIENEGNSTT